MSGPCSLHNRTETQTDAVPDRITDGTDVRAVRLDFKINNVLGRSLQLKPVGHVVVVQTEEVRERPVGRTLDPARRLATARQGGLTNIEPGRRSHRSQRGRTASTAAGSSSRAEWVALITIASIASGEELSSGRSCLGRTLGSWPSRSGGQPSRSHRRCGTEGHEEWRAMSSRRRKPAMNAI